MRFAMPTSPRHLFQSTPARDSWSSRSRSAWKNFLAWPWRIASANRCQSRSTCVCCVWGTYGDMSVCQFRKIFWSSGNFGNRPTCALDSAKLCNLRLPDTLVPFLCLESCNRLLLTAIPGTFYHLFGFFAWLRKDPRRHHWDSKPQ